jgi:hypothetical protein
VGTTYRCTQPMLRADLGQFWVCDLALKAALGVNCWPLMCPKLSKRPTRFLRWRDIYLEAELYKAAVRVYTKPLFLRRSTSPRYEHVRAKYPKW